MSQDDQFTVRRFGGKVRNLYISLTVNVLTDNAYAKGIQRNGFTD